MFLEQTGVMALTTLGALVGEASFLRKETELSLGCVSLEVLCGVCEKRAVRHQT